MRCAERRRASLWAATPSKWTIPNSQTAGLPPRPPIEPSPAWCWIQKGVYPAQRGCGSPWRGNPFIGSSQGNQPPCGVWKTFTFHPVRGDAVCATCCTSAPLEAWEGCWSKAAEALLAPFWNKDWSMKRTFFGAIRLRVAPPYPLFFLPIGSRLIPQLGPAGLGASGARPFLA
jgi:hypothetical protein